MNTSWESVLWVTQCGMLVPKRRCEFVKEERKMGIVVSVAALVLYVPMSMVFVLGGKK